MKKNIFIYSVAFVCSVLLWMYINLNLYYNIVLPVPLEIKLSKSQALGNDLPSFIDVTLKGKGWELIGIMLSRNLTYNLDLTGYKKDSKINLSQTLKDIINLPLGVSILNVTPDEIDVNFDNITSKYVKVRNNVEVFTKDDYSIVGNPGIFPDSIKVTGAMSVINKIKYIPTETVVIRNVNSSFTKTIKILDTLGNIIKIDPKTITVSYNIELSAEKTFEDIEVNIFNIPPENNVLIIPPKITLVIRGGVDQLAKLNPEDISVGIEYKQIENDSSGYIVPKISLPVEANVIKYQPDKFQYIVKKKNNSN
jgi:YbbR domain-containing protein